jgi:hypothetical protein
MAKTFYTERDIEDFQRRGVMVIDIGDDIVLTDLAREKALALGIRLARPGKSTGTAPTAGPADAGARVKAAVIARLGGDVDAALLDAVISRVLAQLK